MQFGFDFDRGGFFEWGRLGRDATGKAKIWWVQAEGLLAALTMFRLTRHAPYLAAFEKTLDWIVRAQIDWRGGEWHRTIDPEGRPSGAKVDRWKGPYHNGRALIACLAIIQELL
jgi:mannobiose 2-epimerase